MSDNNRGSEGGIPESNEAKKLRLLGGVADDVPKEPLKINKTANFWYHNKVKILISAFFIFMITVATVQYASREKPDITMLYAGPDYISPREAEAVCRVIETVTGDINGDGKALAALNSMVFMTDDQAEKFKAQAAEAGEEAALDMAANKKTSERFTYEVFGAGSSICLLARSQYEYVVQEGGFVPLVELFDAPVSGAIDEYGVLLCETKLYEFYDALHVFPEDTVIAMRKMSTIPSFAGKQKAEREYENNRKTVKKLMDFEYPAGYIPKLEEQ